MTTSDRPSSPDRQENPKGSSPARTALVLLLLLAGLAVRLIHAYGLPLDMDENILLEGAREVSIRPGNFNLPIVGPAARHPGFIIWLMGAADWISRGSLFGTRAAFVLLHVGGLFGLYLLTRHLFGSRAAVLALALGVLDRFWIVSSAQLLEPSSFFLMPWIVLVAYQCIHSPWRGCWYVLGILLAIADFYYELSVLLSFAIGLYLILSPEGRRSLRTFGPYAAAALALSTIVMVQVTNLLNQESTLRFAMGVFGTRSPVALSPRVLLLYLSDVMILLRDPSALTLSIADDFYAPYQTPCHWGAGLFYLASVAWALRSWRDRRVALLLTFFFAVAVPMSLIPPKELWSNPHYGGQSVIAAIVLAGWTAGRLLERRLGRVLVAGLFVWLGLSIPVLLRAPKWAYFGPSDEMRFVGEIMYCENRHFWDGTGVTDEDREEIRRRIDDMLETHPDSLVVQQVRFDHASSEEERTDAVRQAKRIAPYAPATALIESQLLRDSGDLARARDCLKAALDRHEGDHLLLLNLARTEYALGEYDEAAKHARGIVKERPNRAEYYGTLLLIYDAQGNAGAAREAFESFRYWCRVLPPDAYLWAAVQFIDQRRYASALPYAREALRLAPQYPKAKVVLGVALAGVGELDRAEALFQAVPSSDSNYEHARECLEEIRAVKAQARSDAGMPQPSQDDEGEPSSQSGESPGETSDRR